MYHATCYGGYPIPLKVGRMEIFGVRATINNAAADSRLTLVDDSDLTPTDNWGKIYASSLDKKKTFLDLRGVGGVDKTLEVWFPEPIKTHNGVSVSGLTNLIGGSIMLYIR